jgi:hypothetical protein
MSKNKTSENKRDYEVGRGKPPVHSRFKEGQPGNPADRARKTRRRCWSTRLTRKVVVTIDGERRKITKREAVVTQLVSKSTGADLRATKMLIDMLKDAEKKAGMTAAVRAEFVDPADTEFGV